MLRLLFTLIAFCVSIFPVFAQPESKEPTPHTKAVNAAASKMLPTEDQKDFEDARRYLIEEVPDLVIKSEKTEKTVWDMKSYQQFIKGEAPDSVHPSLWRIAKLNNVTGLFKVAEQEGVGGIYQVRGFDVSNMTVIETQDGIIIIDPLTCVETSAAALKLYFKHRPRKTILAVIITHSHTDHYGGIHGVLRKEGGSEKTRIIVPEGFLREAVSENIWAGNAMIRRAQFMYGSFLERGVKKQVDSGLGKTTPRGTTGLPGQCEEIAVPKENDPPQIVEIAPIGGVQMQFLLVPDTEAPAEFLIYFPQFKALCAAEDATHTLHNLYTLRGAHVRDAVCWWKALDRCVELFGNDVETVFAQHHWPKWGNTEINQYLRKQRNVYKYIHDRTLNMANRGLTMNEIAETLTFPVGLENEWSIRGYYGTLSHNSKAVYQRYLGWYDSNPAHLNPHPPETSAKKYVEYMGGSASILAKAKTDFEKGNYRWVAEVLNQLVFAEPDNRDARLLLADALEQLGYQSEAGTWRNEYLVGAFELRREQKAPTLASGTTNPETLAATPVGLLLDFAGIALNSEKASGASLTIHCEVTDRKEKHRLELEDSVLVHRQVDSFATPVNMTISLEYATLCRLVMGRSTWEKEKGNIRYEGDFQKLAKYVQFDQFTPDFNIVIP